MALRPTEQQWTVGALSSPSAPFGRAQLLCFPLIVGRTSALVRIVQTAKKLSAKIVMQIGSEHARDPRVEATLRASRHCHQCARQAGVT